jgi:hypothetical protein
MVSSLSAEYRKKNVSNTDGKNKTKKTYKKGKTRVNV